MACFLVATAEAVIISILYLVLGEERARRLRLNWLLAMLWGGIILLAAEHMWHGEIVPWPPFLTAMRSPEDFATMLYEMATIGSAMAIVITLIWALMAYVDLRLRKREVARLELVQRS